MKNLLNYCQGTLAQGSVLSMEKGTPIVGAMPFKQIYGNAYSFNVIDTLVSTEHRELGEDIDAEIIQPTKVTKELMILSNSVKTDRALGIMSDLTDIKSEAQNLAMISSGKALEKKVISELKSYLQKSEAGKEFNGALTTDLLDDAKDHVNPNIIFVSNKTHRALKKLLKAEGQMPETVENFGRRVIAYDTIPVHPTHDLADNEILMVRFGEDGVHGITNGGLQVYEKEVGVNYVTDTELLYAVVCKTKNSFAKLTVTGLRSK